MNGGGWLSFDVIGRRRVLHAGLGLGRGQVDHISPTSWLNSYICIFSVGSEPNSGTGLREAKLTQALSAILCLFSTWPGWERIMTLACDLNLHSFFHECCIHVDFKQGAHIICTVNESLSCSQWQLKISQESIVLQVFSLKPKYKLEEVLTQ